MEVKHIVALSGGKDSTAMALRLAEIEPRDYTYICTPTGDEQAIACFKCGASELIAEDSERLPSGKWPAWEPGPQEFACPSCGEGQIWATEPRHKDEP